MASQKRREANRKNAQKSTGPKSDEGKARSARNGTTHGLTARPENDPTDAGREAYRRRLAEWVADLRPEGAAQQALVEAACCAAWRLERCREHDRAATEERVRHAVDKHDAEARAAAEAEGRPLVEGPYCVIDIRGRSHFDRDEPGDGPASRLDRLQRTAQGADWLLARWEELGAVLEREGWWEDRDKLAAVRLLGRRPEEFLNDPVAREVFGCCHVRTPIGPEGKRRSLWIETRRVIPEGSPRTLDSRRVWSMETQLPGPEEAFRALREIVRRERARLVRLKETVLDARAAADRAGAAERALWDAGPQGERLHRYQTAAGRALSRALADLVRLRKEEGRESGDRKASVAGEAASLVGVGERGEPSDAAPDGMRSEPKTMARSGGDEGRGTATEPERRAGARDTACEADAAVLHAEADPAAEDEGSESAAEGAAAFLRAEADSTPPLTGNRRARRAAAKRARSMRGGPEDARYPTVGQLLELRRQNAEFMRATDPRSED